MAQWMQGAAAATRQEDAGICALDGKIYMTGGMVNGAVSAVVQVYDIEADSWSRIAEMPLARAQHAAVAAGRSVYVLGGAVGNGNNDFIHRYDLDAGAWSLFGSLPHKEIRAFPGAAEMDGMIYLFGGQGESLGKHVISVDLAGGKSALMDVDLSIARFKVGCAVLEDRIYLAGGEVWKEGQVHSSGALECLDPATSSIRTLASTPSSGAAQATAYAGMVYAMVDGSLLLYDPQQNSWRYGQGLPASNRMQSLDAVGDMLVAVDLRGQVFLLDLRTAEIVNAQPAAGFVDERADSRFSWQIAGNAGTAQASAVFQWRVAGSGEIRSIPVDGGASSVLVPAGTFPDGEIEWRASAVTVSGVETGWSAWFALTTVDEPHEPPSNLYPSSGRRNAGTDLQLSWVVNSPLGGAQTAYEVEAAYDEALGWTALSGRVESAAASHIVRGGTLLPGEGGRVFWRVRSYNTDEMAGAWSEAASFLALSPPGAPRWVSVESGRARPLARWTASGQAGYRLRVLRGEQELADTGWRPGSGGEHRLEEYLHDGEYVFEVRVRGELGLESDWASTAALVETETRYEIELDGGSAGLGNHLRFTVRAR